MKYLSGFARPPLLPINTGGRKRKGLVLVERRD